jgi:hypothetical protein
MLKDPIFKTQADDVMMQILNILGKGGKIEKIETGVYLCPHFNFDNYVANIDDDDYGEYGVADNLEQVKAAHAKLINAKNKHVCIAMTKIIKAEQSPEGGWRWHKWGPYIGNKNPQCEYLFDEDESIQEVYCWHIYKLKSEPARKLLIKGDGNAR